MVELYFVRHGQTDWNLEGKLQGIIDVDLNFTGISEAVELTKNIWGDFTKIVSSPLKRAYNTAKILNEKLKLEIISDKRLVERDFGQLAGQKASFVKSMENIENEFNVETIEKFKIKLIDFLEDCSKLKAGKYLIVTHGGVIITLLNYLSDGALNWENTPISNCSITSLKFNGKWFIDFYNARSLENYIYKSCSE